LLAEEFLYRENEFLVIATLLVLLLSATEIGFRWGCRVQGKVEERTKSYYWTLQAGTMGLLGLLLAFAFSMSVARYDSRKQLLVAEANAIGTAYLRSRMLPEPYRSQSARLIGRYVACRLDNYGTAMDEKQTAAANLACALLQNRLWSRTMEAVANNPAPVPTGMFASSVNDLIDAASRRDAARENHVPQPVLIFLLLVTILTLALAGYGCGLGNRRHLAATTTICLLLSLVILVIIDLDRPRRGLITISQSPMLELQSSLK
jgi:F0F1-type ATP synthase membrane subunit c/vacuolar-type H+-ATPase subunit K